MSDRLFIIGNGLDLFFNLPTKVDNFIHFLNEQTVSDSHMGENAMDIYSNLGVSWGEWEEGLSDIDVESLISNCEISPNYNSNHEDDITGTIYEVQSFLDSLIASRNNALQNMVSNADNELELKIMNNNLPKYNKELFESSDLVINFNYTYSVEKLFNTNDLQLNYHIHGCLRDGSNLIFGYKNDCLLKQWQQKLKDERQDAADNLIEVDPILDRQEESIIHFYKENKKDFQYSRLKERLMQNNTIDFVVVLGHSMSSVDSKYMEMVESLLHPKKWYISYYNIYDKPDIGQYSFKKDVDFVPFDKLITGHFH